MVGILAHGNNHYILSGPPPNDEQAVALARYWSVVRIGELKSASWRQWTIRDKEFRENLEWAVLVQGERPTSPGVTELLAELAARGIEVRQCTHGCW